MSIRKSLCFSILLICGIFFFWQMLLIVITLKEDLLGINLTCFNRSSNIGGSSIPRIIHQMWKTSNLSTYPIDNSHSQWKKHYPDYKIYLWTDKDIENLLNEDKYIHLNEIYYSYSYSIQRADLGRLILLDHFGGIYVDLDVFPSSREIEKIRLSNVSLIIARSSSGLSLINHFLVSQKSSPILHFILHQVFPRKFYERIFLLPYLEVFSTGSIFLTSVIRKYLRLSNNSRHFLWILSEKHIKDYVTHNTGRSWHSFDGWIFNHIDENPKLSIWISFFFFFTLFLFWKYRNSLSDFFILKKSFFSAIKK